MNLKDTFKKLYNSDPRVMKKLDSMFPNDSLIKQIKKDNESEGSKNSQEGEEKK